MTTFFSWAPVIYQATVANVDLEVGFSRSYGTWRWEVGVDMNDGEWRVTAIGTKPDYLSAKDRAEDIAKLLISLQQ